MKNNGLKKFIQAVQAKLPDAKNFLVALVALVIILPIASWLFWLSISPEKITGYLQAEIKENIGLDVQFTSARKTLTGMVADNVVIQIPDSKLTGFLSRVEISVIHPSVLFGTIPTQLSAGSISVDAGWPIFGDVVFFEMEKVPLHLLNTNKIFQLMASENFLSGSGFYDLEQNLGEIRLEIEDLKIDLSKIKIDQFQLPSMELEFSHVRLTSQFKGSNFDVKFVTAGSFNSRLDGKAWLNIQEPALSELDVIVKGSIDQAIFEERNILTSILKAIIPDGQVYGKWSVKNKKSSWQYLE